MHSRSERGCKFCISGCNATPTLRAEKRVFHKVAEFIQVSIVIALLLSTLPRGDQRLHSRRRRFFNNFTTVISPVSQQILSLYPINQGTSLRTINDGTSCDKESDRHTMRIHGQMYLGVEPHFVRAISWFPPGAPLA